MADVFALNNVLIWRKKRPLQTKLEVPRPLTIQIMLRISLAMNKPTNNLIQIPNDYTAHLVNFQ